MDHCCICKVVDVLFLDQLKENIWGYICENILILQKHT